jgi:hypothetical protein
MPREGIAMQTILLASVLLGGAPSLWCSSEQWDRQPQRCLEHAGLTELFDHWQVMVRDLSGSLKIPVPSLRVGGLHDSGAGHMEVWHIGEGAYEVRVRPRVLRDASVDTLLASSAHEVCHILHGDAGYGTWNSWTEKKRKERQRVAWACALAVVGEDVIKVYLNEAETKYTPYEKNEVLRRMKYDAKWWLDWRRKTQKVVP